MRVLLLLPGSPSPVWAPADASGWRIEYTAVPELAWPAALPDKELRT